jgi:hypothetical protein
MNDFNLTYFARRRNSTVTLTIRKTSAGWHISRITINGDGDQEGAPFLNANLQQDGVEYPVHAGRFMAFIWQSLQDEEIGPERAQEMFDELGEWISTCESSQPVWAGWNA